MELDSRIINGKRPLTCFDIEEAEKYIGKLCYMCDEYNLFYQLNLIEPAILMGVEDCEIPFHNGQDKQAEFCLPCEWVTEEKQFRPCTLDDFGLNIGDLIKFRRKDDHNIEVCTMYMGYMKNNGIVKVMLGNTYYSLEELFNDYEWYDRDSSTWEIFGVKE